MWLLQAWSEFASFLEEGRHRLGANFVVQLRFTAADEIVLSPVSGGSSKGGYYVAVATLIKNIDSQAYFRGASDIWLRHGGRPHWGKSHFLEQVGDQPNGRRKEGPLAACCQEPADWWVLVVHTCAAINGQTERAGGAVRAAAGAVRCLPPTAGPPGCLPQRLPPDPAPAYGYPVMMMTVVMDGSTSPPPPRM